MRLTLLVALVAMATAGCGRSPTAPSESLPSIRQIQPAALSVGDTLTIIGDGFSGDSNWVQIDAGYLPKIGSADGTTLRIQVPAYLSPCPPYAEVCAAFVMLLTPGSHRVSVVTARGTSNAVPLQVVAVAGAK